MKQQRKCWIIFRKYLLLQTLYQHLSNCLCIVLYILCNTSSVCGCTSSVVQQVSLCSQLSQTKRRSALRRMLARCISPDSVVFHMAFLSLSRSVVLLSISGNFSLEVCFSSFPSWLGINSLPHRQLASFSIHPSSSLHLCLCLHLRSFVSLPINTLLSLCSNTLRTLHPHSFHSLLHPTPKLTSLSYSNFTLSSII